jgi:seryl-tRNA synthetase
LLVELPSLGKVTERRFAARDVTAAHRDLRVRIDNLKRERDRYLALLERAENIPDATGVEREVERLTSQLELLEAQLQAMGDRVHDAALHLDFSRELRPGPIGYVFYAVYSGVKWLFVRD